MWQMNTSCSQSEEDSRREEKERQTEGLNAKPSNRRNFCTSDSDMRPCSRLEQYMDKPVENLHPGPQTLHPLPPGSAPPQLASTPGFTIVSCMVGSV